MNQLKVEYLKSKSGCNLSTAAALNTIVKKTCIFCNANNNTSLKCKKITKEQKIYELKKEGWYYRCFYKHLQYSCKMNIQLCLTNDSLQRTSLSLFCPKQKQKMTSQIKSANFWKKKKT